MDFLEEAEQILKDSQETQGAVNDILEWLDMAECHPRARHEITSSQLSALINFCIDHAEVFRRKILKEFISTYWEDPRD